MGFFKKIFKGVKKVFKKIGRGIKKVVGKVGKFMNKIGWVGQLALQFILPGIGTMLSMGLKGLGAIGGALGAVAKPLAWVMNQAGKFAKVGSNVFRTVTSGIKSFVGNMGKAVLSKLPGGSKLLGAMNMETIGFKDAWGKVQTEIGNNFKGILDPFKVAKGESLLGRGRTLESISKSTGLSVEELGEYNPSMVKGMSAEEWGAAIAPKGSRVAIRPSSVIPTGPSTLPKHLRTTPKPIDLGEPLDIDFDIPSTGDMRKSSDAAIDQAIKGDIAPAYKAPSLLDPYGKSVSTAIKQTMGIQEAGAAGAAAAASGKGGFIFDPDEVRSPEEERLSATAVDFGALAGEIASNVRANYDRLMREGGMFGYSQTVYDEWSRSKPGLPAIGSIA